MAAACARAQPQALVYHDNTISPGLSESVQELLENSPRNFNVTIVGPKEDVDITPKLLSQATIIAFPGGPDVNNTWRNAKQYKTMVQDFVRNGGHYMGFCLGAYLASDSPGFALMPKGASVGSEIEQDGAQIDDPRDDVLQVSWKFVNGTQIKKRWVYFQEGAVIQGLDDSSPYILSRYSSNNDVAASVTPYGKGTVALTGFHSEADEEWYEEAEVTNPDGIQTDIGYDFIEAALRKI